MSELRKTTMYELPTLNDSNVLAIIGNHPEEFFKAMKEFEPYILIRAAATGLEIKPRNSYVDLEKLGATFEHLKRLGYHPEAHNSTYTMPNGRRMIDLDSITIDWKKECDKSEKVSASKRIDHISHLLKKVIGKLRRSRNGWN